MSKSKVESLVLEVYGEGCSVQSGDVGNGIVQAVVLHPSGIPLAIVTARSESAVWGALEAALQVIKAG